MSSPPTTGLGMSVGRLEAFSEGVSLMLALALLYLLPTPDVGS